jgi:hypothetical protein
MAFPNFGSQKQWAALARGPKLWLRGRDLNPRPLGYEIGHETLTHSIGGTH